MESPGFLSFFNFFEKSSLVRTNVIFSKKQEPRPQAMDHTLDEKRTHLKHQMASIHKEMQKDWDGDSQKLLSENVKYKEQIEILQQRLSDLKLNDSASVSEENKITQRTLNFKQRDINLLEQDISKLKKEYSQLSDQFLVLLQELSEKYEKVESLQQIYLNESENLDPTTMSFSFEMIISDVINEIVKIKSA